GERGHQHDNQRRQDSAIHDGARAEQAIVLVLHGVFRTVTDQAARIAHLIHHRVARVNAGGAGNALVLQALAYVDTGGTNLYAKRAINAVALPLRLVIAAAPSRATGL